MMSARESGILNGYFEPSIQSSFFLSFDHRADIQFLFIQTCCFHRKSAVCLPMICTDKSNSITILLNKQRLPPAKLHAPCMAVCMCTAYVEQTHTVNTLIYMPYAPLHLATVRPSHRHSNMQTRIGVHTNIDWYVADVCRTAQPPSSQYSLQHIYWQFLINECLLNDILHCHQPKKMEYK